MSSIWIKYAHTYTVYTHTHTHTNLMMNSLLNLFVELNVLLIAIAEQLFVQL